MILSNNVLYQVNTNSIADQKIFPLESTVSIDPIITGHLNENYTFMVFTNNKKCILIDTTRAEITQIKTLDY